MSDMLTEAELDELEALERNANVAPWWPVEFSDETACIMNEHVGITDRPCDLGPRPKGEVPCLEDARLIAAARNALPRLLAEVRRLRAELARRGGGDG